MNECQKHQKLFADALYGSLDDIRRSSFEAHLGQCDLCREEYAGLRATLQDMEKRERSEPKPEFWEGYWERLGSRMHRENILYRPRPSGQRRPSWDWLRFRVPRWAFQAGAAMLLVAVGIFIGRMWLLPPSAGVQTAAQTGGSTSPYSLELASRTQDYVQRSQLVLMAIVNFDRESDDPYTLDLPYKQRLSRELVQEAGWLKQGLADARQRRLQELVSDLEAVLLQIANLEAAEDMDAIELVQTGVQGRGLFLKMHLAEVNRPWDDLKTQTETPPKTDKTKIF
ncbi:MAG: hypothetical protein WBB73_09730 [Candidatus Aminicenantaceae bacterium]